MFASLSPQKKLLITVQKVLYSTCCIYILIPYWMLRPSVILSVRYRNHFPVVQFQNQAHIWNPHGMGHVVKTIWGAAGARIFFFVAEGGVS